MVTIGVVAAGAMGAAMGARLGENGARVLTSLEGRSGATRARADAAGMAAGSDEEIARADIVLSVVPPNEAVGLAARIGAAAGRIGSQPIYVDLNAVSPATARAVGVALGGCGAVYVDGCIIGLPPVPGSAGPTVYVSGEAAGAAEVLGQHGLAVKTLAGGIGAASALKMSYAGMTKGLTGLATAMILAAEREGAGAALAAEMASSQVELLARLRKSVPDMLPKAYRWAPEMEEIAAFLGADDPARGVYEAMAAVYRAVAADEAVGEKLMGFFSG